MLKSPIEDKLIESKRVLGIYEQRMKEYRGRKNSKMIVNAFWITLIVIIIGSISAFAFSQKDVALAFVQDKVGTLMNNNTQPQTTVSNQSCKDIVIKSKPTDDNPDGKSISAVYVGSCYNISEADREYWNGVFSISQAALDYSNHIYSVSEDKSLTPDQIEDAVRSSLNTGILDLRTTQTSSLPEPTKAPVEEVTSTPEPTPTEAVSVVPFPEKEKALDLESLVATMMSHNIKAVASNNDSKDLKDRINWLMWYEIGGGEKDYLVFSTLNSKLPPACTNDGVTFISISLNNTGLDGETAIKAGDTKVWIVCQ